MPSVYLNIFEVKNFKNRLSLLDNHLQCVHKKIFSRIFIS